MSATRKYKFRERKRKACEPDVSSELEETETNMSPVMEAQPMTHAMTTVTTRPIKKRKLSRDTTATVSTATTTTTSTSPRKSSSSSSKTYIQFDIRSWAWMDRSPFRSHVKLSHSGTSSTSLKTFDIQKRRGHRVVVIDGVTGNVEQSLVFDTWADIYAGVRFKIFLKTLQFRANKWVVIIAHDSAYNICSSFVSDELANWGALPANRALHREAYVLVMSSNRREKWWEYVVDAPSYFSKKYTQTMQQMRGSSSSSKKQKQKHKQKHVKTKPQKKPKHKAKQSTRDNDDDAAAAAAPQEISAAQHRQLSSFGGCNVFFERKTAEKKGPILIKGFLPKMKPVPVSADRNYRTLTPHALAMKAGTQPCDRSTNEFYCASCLDTADARHMLVCCHASHGADDDTCQGMREKAVREYAPENFESVWDYEEDERMTKMRHYGQACHVYCVPYPETVWQRWRWFMQLSDDEWSVPDFVTLNIQKYRKRWNGMKANKDQKLDLAAASAGDNNNNNSDVDVDEINEAERTLHAKKEQTRQYFQLPAPAASDETSIETGLGLNPYDEIYSELCMPCADGADLSRWRCRWHDACEPFQPLIKKGNRHFCACGKPMVQQVCGNADGEVGADLRGDGFQGLWCQGCNAQIARDQTVFRCMMGARCTASNDGMDYCLQCMVGMMTTTTTHSAQAQSQIRCLCGDALLLGTVHDMKRVFHAAADAEHGPRSNSSSQSMSSSNSSRNSVIKKTSTYRCAWCLHKFTHKNDTLYYCPRQTVTCVRVLRQHLLQLQPFVVCVACALQSVEMTQQCSCGSNLHCRLLADWIHHDGVCYEQNRLPNAPLVPNRFRAHGGKGHKSKNKNSKNEEDDKDSSTSSCCSLAVSVASVLPASESSSLSAYDFYVQRRYNDDEESFYDELSRKFVQCALCAAVIDAYKFVFICNRREAHAHCPHYLCAACAVQQRRKTQLFPDRDENVELCLLFVAHDGIAQSQLWRQWLAEAQETIGGKIGISVQCNNYETLKHGREFAERHRIDVQRPTEWGKLTVPLTIQKSVQLSLRKYPNCRRFYVVSGREIPLVSAQHLYAMPDKTQLMAKKITQKTATKLRKTRLAKVVQFFSHHAAMCLSRTHAEMISTAPWKEYFAESDHLYDGIGAPDEFIVGTTLHAMGVDMRREVWREVTTDWEIPCIKHVRHPINWESLDNPVEFWRVSDTLEIEGKERKSLKQLLIERYSDSSKLWGYGPCFFRKVSASVEFGSFVPWQLCTLKPPIVDAEKGIDETVQYRDDVDSTAYMDLDEIHETLQKQKNTRNIVETAKND